MLDKLSDEAVKKATGKVWADWFKILDKAGAKKWPHKDTARWLYDQGLIKSGWWTQSVTVAYEKARGLRVLGQTATSGFEVGAQKTISLPAQDAWKLIISAKGLKLWLGDISDFKPMAGYGYRTREGINGEIRTVTNQQRLRLTWKLPEWRNFSTLQIYILPKGDKTALHFHQEKLVDGNQREAMRKHWQTVLQKLESCADGPARKA